MGFFTNDRFWRDCERGIVGLVVGECGREAHDWTVQVWSVRWAWESIYRIAVVACGSGGHRPAWRNVRLRSFYIFHVDMEVLVSLSNDIHVVCRNGSVMYLQSPFLNMVEHNSSSMARKMLFQFRVIESLLRRRTCIEGH